MGEETLSYHQRLQIPVLTINSIKKHILTHIISTKEAWKRGIPVKTICIHIIGPAGIGKTDICRQIANEIKEKVDEHFQLIMIKAPVLTRDEFIIPFPVKDETEIPRFRVLYSDFIPDPGTRGLFVIDECMRGDHQLQQLLWQIQNEQMVHTYPFPPGWFIVSTDNPDEAEYTLDILQDAAGLRRQMHFYVEVSVQEFLIFAKKYAFHDMVVDFVTAYPQFLYDFDAQKMGAVYSNPASWERLSDELHKLDCIPLKDDKKKNSIEEIAGSLLNTKMATIFMEYCFEKKGINPRDILFDFNKVMNTIEKMIKEKDGARLSELVVSYFTYLCSEMPKVTKKELENHGQFLSLVPIDAAAVFISNLDSIESEEANIYMMELHDKAIKIKSYREGFHDRVLRNGVG